MSRFGETFLYWSVKKVLLVVGYRGEGAKGFYKGLGVNLTRVVPATVLTFVTYEHVSHTLLGLKTVNIADTTTTNQVPVRHEKN